MPTQIIKPNTRYPFIDKRKPFGIVSAILVLVTLLIPIAVMSPNWGTSFRGGTSIVVRFEDNVDSKELRQAFVDLGFKDPVVQTFGGDNNFLIKTSQISTADCDKFSDESQKAILDYLASRGVPSPEFLDFPACEDVRDSFTVRFKVNPEATKASAATPAGGPTLRPRRDARDPKSGVTVEALGEALLKIGVDAAVTYESRGERRRFVVRPRALQVEVARGLEEKFGDRFDPDRGIAEVVSVGPDVGEKFRNDGIVSILFALGLILLYIAIRFDVRYAPGAVVALIHDVVITFGILTLIQMEITLETVAALLAIVGYSLNDTIVTFDRIRENINSGSDEPIATIVNRSINECLSRTILTSVTTLIAITFLAIIGSGVVADFAVTLIIGVAIGTYSSIFIASPIMLYMHGVIERRRSGQAPRPSTLEADASSPG